MSASVDIRCEGVGEMTLEKISELLAQRAEVLGETTKDAVIASAIDILISVRAKTKDAKKRKGMFKPGVTEVAGVYLSYGAGRQRCLRVGSPRTGARFNIGRARLCYAGRPTASSKVFKVVPEHKRDAAYYVVAQSAADAKDYEARRSSHRIETYGTLAKWALGVAMNKLSTRTVKDGVSANANQVASNLSQVLTEDKTSGIGAGTFGVQVIDALDYSIAALKSSNAVEMAMQAAGNKISGMMQRHLKRLGDFTTKIETPFPSVRRRKN